MVGHNGGGWVSGTLEDFETIFTETLHTYLLITMLMRETNFLELEMQEWYVLICLLKGTNFEIGKYFKWTMLFEFKEKRHYPMSWKREHCWPTGAANGKQILLYDLKSEFGVYYFRESASLHLINKVIYVVHYLVLLEFCHFLHHFIGDCYSMLNFIEMYLNLAHLAFLAWNLLFIMTL